MLKSALVLVSLALQPAVAAGPSPLTTVQFSASQALRLAPTDPTPELARMFAKGKASSLPQSEGWYSGRRWTSKGPVAALLAGDAVVTASSEKADVFDDPEAEQLDRALERWDRQEGVEIRVNGKLFVARYPNGDYGYFLKKVK